MEEQLESYGAYVFIKLQPEYDNPEEAIEFFMKLLNIPEVDDWHFVKAEMDDN
jgi:hypothetical protein